MENTAQNRMTQNQTTQNQTTQNQTTQNQTTQNQTTQNQTAKNQTTQNQTVQNQTMQDRAWKNILAERVIHEEQLYEGLMQFATKHNLPQTMAALPFAKKMHEGQFRKGKERIPYIYHPLMVAAHALTLGFVRDDMIATAILHDVCEDCGVTSKQLPVGEDVQLAVSLLTKPQKQRQESGEEQPVWQRQESGEGQPVKQSQEEAGEKPHLYHWDAYYEAIEKNQIALFVKLLDRCNNLSCMTNAFNAEKQRRYIDETIHYYFPMMERAKERYPEYAGQLFLIRYQMISVIEAIGTATPDSRNPSD